MSNDLRLLSLDGGGVRGLSALRILEELMYKIDHEKPPKPCDYFHLIGGTSTGGLIAIMLGRLRMSISDCIEAYLKLSDRIFQKKNRRVTIRGKVQGRFDSDELARAVKDVLLTQGLKEDALLKDESLRGESGHACRVFVCATSKETCDTVLLTSYESRGSMDLLNGVKIWEACRATSAASSFFDPIAIGRFEEEFVDGATGANNPVWQVWSEAQYLYGPQPLENKIRCFVSIGTGVPPLKAFKDDVLQIHETLIAIATETERTAENFRRDKTHLDNTGRYYRFNVNRGLEEVGLEESKKKKEIAAAARLYTESQSVSKQMQACVEIMAKNIEDQEKEILREKENKECLQHLHSTDPRHDKARIEQTKGGLLKNSYIWILHNADFQQWRDSSESRLLWIKGDPGKGKTMLLCGIIDELEKSTAKTSLLVYFFCQATDERINSAIAVLRGLIYLLVNQQPSLISHMRERYDSAGKALFENANAWFALSQIFINILQDPRLKSIYLVIDALDECVTDLTPLLDLIIQQLSVSSRVKWIISSRNWQNIEERLEAVGQKVRLCLELNPESTSTAVSRYIQYKVRQLAQAKKYDNKTESAVQAYLSSNSNNTFLWVALACQNLEKYSRWSVLPNLKTIPPGLDSLYERMMQQICNSGDVDLSKQILAIATLTRRPITLKELTTFIEKLEDVSEDTESLGDIIGLCGSFLTLREHTIYFVHQSAKDFLLGKASSTIFPSGMEEVNYTIFSRSLQVMSRTLRRDLYGLQDKYGLCAHGVHIKDVELPDLHPLDAVKYSCVYWVDHLCDWDSGKSTKHSETLQDGGLVDNFLRQKYIYWLESLSLCGGISEGIISIAKLEDLLQGKAEAPQLIDLVQDAHRFIRYYKLAIEDTPLQVYTSPLVFSPACSLIRESFKKEEPEWITTKPATQDEWSSCLQTLEDHSESVHSVDFSHSDKQLASASDDNTIKIWDTASGKCLQTLEGHGFSVHSVSFSHNDKQLASASYDKTIKIWDTALGKCLQTLKGHGGFVLSVAFSHNDKQLASASYDKTIKIWDTASGKCLQTLEGHGGRVFSVAFSHNDKQLASASYDKTIKIWDTTLGKYLQIIEGHGSFVFSVAFSHNDKQLASASDDNTIKIWDTASGKCLQTLEGHGFSVFSVSFSHNDKQLASASDDKTIKIWDTASGKCLQTIGGHGGRVNSVAFSHNDKQLASASDDNTIKIWDTALGKCLQTLEGHSESVHSVAFSHNDKQLSSVSYDNTIKIWDTASGKCLQTLEGHGFSVHSVAFSHNDKQLASASYDKTIKIWDTASGKCLQTLEGHGGRVFSVAFSHNDKQLASASDDNTIKIWDTASGKCLQTLEGHGKSVHSVAFSHNNKKLASASDDKTIKVWDTASGKCLQTIGGHGGRVNSVAFFHNDKQLASGSYDRTIKIWDTASGKCLQTLDAGMVLYNISFDTTCQYIYTELGAIAIDLSLASSIASKSTIRRHGYGLSIDGKWVMYNSEKLLWLPSEYRPSCSAMRASTVAIGCASGQVLIFNFKDHPHPSPSNLQATPGNKTIK